MLYAGPELKIGKEAGPCCHGCGRDGRWVLKVGEEIEGRAICGWCLLYVSWWGEGNRAGIDRVVEKARELEKMTKKPVELVDGRLSVVQAERLVAGVMMTSRVLNSRRGSGRL